MNILLYDKEYIQNVLIPTLEQHYGFELTMPKYVEIFQGYADIDYKLNDAADLMPEAFLYFGELTVMTKPKNKKNEFWSVVLDLTTSNAVQNKINTEFSTIESFQNFDNVKSVKLVDVPTATSHKYQGHIHFTRFIDTYLDLYLNTEKILTVKPTKEYQTLKFENVTFNSLYVINGEPAGYIKFNFKGYRFNIKK